MTQPGYLSSIIRTGLVVTLTAGLGLYGVAAQEDDVYPDGQYEEDYPDEDYGGSRGDEFEPLLEEPEEEGGQRARRDDDDGFELDAGDVVTAVAIGAMAAALLNQRAQAEEDADPVILPIPPRVAYLRVTLFARDGVLQGAALQDTAIVNSYAPKTFARDSGEWMVMVYGQGMPVDTPMDTAAAMAEARRQAGPEGRDWQGRLLSRYRIRNPLNGIEQQALMPSSGSSPGALYEPVRLTGQYDWRLVLPLYDDEMAYDVDSIRIVDIDNEREVLAVRF